MATRKAVRLARESCTRLFARVALVNGRLAVGGEEQDRVRLAHAALHAGGTGDHAGDGETLRIRAFLHKAADFRGRDVTLNCVTIDRGRVAGLEIIGNAEFGPVRTGVLHILYLEFETVRAHVRDPL